MRNLKGMAAALALLAGTPALAETTLIFNSYMPPKNEIMRTGVVPWAEAVEKATDGSVKVEFSASSLAPPPRQLDMIRSRIADAAVNISSFTAPQWLGPLISELPLMFDEASAEAHSVALWRTYREFFADKEDLGGVHVVSLWALTGNHVWNNVRRVETADDAQGIKLRVNPNGVGAAEALGAVVVSRPAVESFEVITRGVVDGTLLPIGSVDGLGLEEELNFGTLVGDGLYRSTVSIIMNEDAWNDLTEEERQAIDAISGEALARSAGNRMDTEEKEILERIRGAGIAINEMPQDQVDVLKGRVAAEHEAWAARVRELGLDPEAVVSFYREQLQAVAG